MNQNIVFSKTPESLATLNAHTLKIGSRLKFTYMLVDGHSSVDRLHKKSVILSDLEPNLEQLALKGYVRVNNKEWDDIAFQNTGHPISDFIQSTGNPIETIRSILIDYSIMVLGKHANNTVHKFREAMPDIDELFHTAKKSVKTARLLIDENDADILQEKYSDIFGLYQL